MSGLPLPPTPRPPPPGQLRGWRPVAIVAGACGLLVAGLVVGSLLAADGDETSDGQPPDRSWPTTQAPATDAPTAVTLDTTTTTSPPPVPLAADEGALVVTERQIGCCHPEGSVGLLQVQGWDGLPSTPVVAGTSTRPPPAEDSWWPQPEDADYRTYEPLALPAGTYTVWHWQHPCSGTCPPSAQLQGEAGAPDRSDLCIVDVVVTPGATTEVESRWAPGRGCLRFWQPGDRQDTSEADDVDRPPSPPGLVPYSGEPGMPGVGPPPPEARWAQATYRAAGGLWRREVLGAPEGPMVGYDYRELGYVPRALADHPQFDPRRLTIARHGCVPVEERGCNLLAIADFDTIADAEASWVPFLLGVMSPELRARALAQMPPDVRAWSEAQLAAAYASVTTTLVPVSR